MSGKCEKKFNSNFQISGGISTREMYDSNKNAKQFINLFLSKPNYFLVQIQLKSGKIPETIY